MTAAKSARLNVRLTPVEESFLRAAAKASGQTVTEFLMTTALAHAHEVLADQNDLVLAPHDWDEFVALLDAPVEPDPQLVELFGRPRRIKR